MVTRHLYEIEDVAAMLLYGIAAGDRRTARHAARELEDSLEHDLLSRLLLLAWMLLPADPATDGRCAQVAWMQSRHTLLEVLLSGVRPAGVALYPDLPTHPTYPPPPSDVIVGDIWLDRAKEWQRPVDWTLAQTAVFLRAVQYALRRGHWEHAARLTHVVLPYKNACILSLLRVLDVANADAWATLLESTVFVPLTARILEHMYAAAVAPPLPPCAMASSAPRLPTTVRSGRTFTVLPQALSAWHVSAKPMSRLMGEPICIADDDACAYWQSVCVKHGVRLCEKKQRLVFPNDSALDTLYATEFGKDDIPDEWSVTEREKSHAPAAANPTATCKNPWVPAFHFCWV